VNAGVSLTEMNVEHAVRALPYWARDLFMVSPPLVIFSGCRGGGCLFRPIFPEQITGLQENVWRLRVLHVLLGRLDPFRHRPWCERQAERMSLTP
jgi:hypothetical protein